MRAFRVFNFGVDNKLHIHDHKIKSWPCQLHNLDDDRYTVQIEQLLNVDDQSNLGQKFITNLHILGESVIIVISWCSIQIHIQTHWLAFGCMAHGQIMEHYIWQPLLEWSRLVDKEHPFILVVADHVSLVSSWFTSRSRLVDIMTSSIHCVMWSVVS